jgi:hypothetical protein
LRQRGAQKEAVEHSVTQIGVHMSKPTLNRPRKAQVAWYPPNSQGICTNAYLPRRIEAVSKAKVYTAFMEGVQSGLREAALAVRGAR